MILRTHFLVDLDRRRLHTPDGRPVGAQRVTLFARDTLIHSFAVQRGAGTTAPLPVDLDGLQFRWGLKRAGDLHEVEKLAFSDIDQINIVGDWTDADLAEGKLSVRIDLNTVPIEALFAGASDTIACVAELEARTGEDQPTTLVQYAVALTPDVVRGDAPPPEPGQPEYLTLPDGDARYLVVGGEDRGQKIVTASDGKSRLAYYFDDDDTWRVLLPVVVDGQPTFAWEDVA